MLRKLSLSSHKYSGVVVSIKSWLRRRPFFLMVVVFLLSIIILSAFECGRAWFYLRSSADYRTTAKMQMLRESVDKLARSAEMTSPSYFCDVSEENLISGANEAYGYLGNGENASEKLVAKIRGQLIDVSPAPAFSSLLNFLPRTKQARSLSVDMSKAITDLKKLAEDDARSVYCLELRTALSQVYFIKDLQTPEGVSALQPGQVENFQASVDKARELFLTMRFPEVFSNEHTEFIKILNEVAVSLRQNDNNYTEFARRIEEEKKAIATLLETIKLKSVDLQEKPALISLQAHMLYGAK